MGKIIFLLLLVIPLIFSCASWSPYYAYKVNYHRIIYGDRFRDFYGPNKMDLRTVMDANPDFPYESASYDQIVAVFGKDYVAKQTYRYPRIQNFEGRKIYFDKDITYFGGENDKKLIGNFKGWAGTSLRLMFFLYMDKVQFVIMIDETYFDDFTNNAYTKAGEYHRFTDKDGWPRPKLGCDNYFFHTFSLGTSRGNHNNAGYAFNCDFDYDPEYWKDPIYQPIWNPREMGTLEQLDIKEVK